MSNPQAEALGKYNRRKRIRKSPLLDNKGSWPISSGLKCGGTRRWLRGPSPPNLLTPAPKEIRLLTSVSLPLQHAWDSYIYVEHPAVSPSSPHQACPSEPPNPGHLYDTQPPTTGVTLMSSISGPPSVHDSFLPALPFTPRPSSPPRQLPCAPRRGCGRQRPGPERGQGRAARAHHGEAGEQSRSPAGGFELGAAQVEFAPGQRLHRVLVEAHHLGVTLADPVRVGDRGRRRRRRRPRGLPVPAAAAAPAAAAGAVAAAEGKLGAVAARGRGGLRMHGARCKGAGRPGRLLGQRPPPRAAPPPPLEEAAAWPQRGSGLSRPAAKSK